VAGGIGNNKLEVFDIEAGKTTGFKITFFSAGKGKVANKDTFGI
jgi:hypothetical protein